MLDNPIDQITLADIQQLVDDRWSETKTVEYKRTMYAFKDDKEKARRELCKDVLTFANSGGGHIIIGVADKDGTPVELTPFDCPNPDNVRLQMLDFLRNWTEPSISPEIHWIRTDDLKHVFVIRVDESILAPHSVILPHGIREFWTRSSAGATPMDTDALRQAFTFSQSIVDRMRAFRMERVKRIHSNDMLPVSIAKGSKLIIHFLPLSEYRRSNSVVLDVKQLRFKVPDFSPMGLTWSDDPRVNLDGVVYLINPDQPNETCQAYTQVYRTGKIEAVATRIGGRHEGGAFLYPNRCEEYLLQAFKRYLPALKQLGAKTPIWCFVSITDVHNARIRETTPLIDRNDLMFPEFEIADFDADLSELLRPICDLIWNAGGLPESQTFDALVKNS